MNRDEMAVEAMRQFIPIYSKIRCPKERIENVPAWKQELRVKIAKESYALADAMIQERDRTTKI